MTKRKRTSIILCIVSYPLSYLLATLFCTITSFAHGLWSPLIPIADSNVAVISLVICINVISLISFLADKPDKAH